LGSKLKAFPVTLKLPDITEVWKYGVS
jgi:hypothetical protein